MSGPQFVVTFTITEDDLIAYLQVAQQWLNLVGSAIAIGLIAAGILVTAVTSDTLSGAMLMIVGVSFYALGNTNYFERWRVRRVGRTLIGTDAKLTIDDDGITSETATGSGRIGWSAVTEVKENRRMLVIRRDRVNAAWIPKRAFASPEELAAVEALINEHVKDRART